MFSAPIYKGNNKYFDGKTFKNIDSIRNHTGKDAWKWFTNRKPAKWTYENNIPLKNFNFTNNSKVRVFFINHSTFLLQIDTINILTDPIWSKRCSPLSWIGPKRHKNPGIEFNSLPHIHYILLSHNHYDHLNINTLKKLKDKFNPTIITSLGVCEYLKNKGFKKLIELDWWQSEHISNACTVSSTPAQHFSNRGMTDRNGTHWCGFIVNSDFGTIYYAGDTGYGSFFTQIGEKYNIDVALLPIGASKPRWFMKPVHSDPSDAIIIHKELKSKLSIPCHYGTFALGDDGMYEHVDILKDYIKKDSMLNFKILKEGEYVEVVK